MKVLLDIPDSKAAFAIKVLRSLSFVKKAKPMSLSNAELWEDLKEAANEVKLHKKGKVQLKTAQGLLDELQRFICHRFEKEVTENPEHGTFIGNSCYKIRLAIESKNKGKSGGARVVTYLFAKAELVYLLTIYDKSEKEDLKPKELLEMIESLELD